MVIKSVFPLREVGEKIHWPVLLQPSHAHGTNGGACLLLADASTGAPWLVFEYMPHGDLAEVLRANSGVFSAEREDTPTLKLADLWWLALQIARGMLYLEERHFTHR